MLCSLKKINLAHVPAVGLCIYNSVCDILGRTVAPDPVNRLTSAVKRLTSPTSEHEPDIRSVKVFKKGWTMSLASVCVVDWLSGRWTDALTRLWFTDTLLYGVSIHLSTWRSSSDGFQWSEIKTVFKKNLKSITQQEGRTVSDCDFMTPSGNHKE